MVNTYVQTLLYFDKCQEFFTRDALYQIRHIKFGPQCQLFASECYFKVKPFILIFLIQYFIIVFLRLLNAR